MRPSPPKTHGHGAIVLAAFRPDPQLLVTQLRTIQAQSVEDFTCLIGADGDYGNVRDLVAQSVGGDQRFRVLGWQHNVGFYLNFERLLQAVPRDCRWIALCDQDDAWHSDKLARLLPLLQEHILATGQARVVRATDEVVLQPATTRMLVSPLDLLLQNQVSGALCVFRTELLEVALPFPRLNAPTQLHDHWLAMCATATGGYAVLDEVVQDYVQHGSNVVGEARQGRLGSPLRLWQLWLGLARTYEGSGSPKALLSVSRRLAFRWRRLMLDELQNRGPFPALTGLAAYASGRRGAIRLAWRAIRSPRVSWRPGLALIAGLPGELLDIEGGQ